MEHIDKGWFAVVNPHAGNGKTIVEWSKAETLLHDRGIDYSYMTTGRKHHAAEIARQASEKGCRKFIAVGGDGTVHEVLDGIMTFVDNAALHGYKAEISDFYLAVIPVGSGNDWIRIHNVPHDTEKVIDLIADWAFVPQDIVRVSLPGSGEGAGQLKCTYMINIGGTGFDARICERVNAKKDAGKSGKMLYVNSLLYYLARYGHSAVRVVCDGETVYDGSCYSIAFGTGRYSGGGLRQTPDAVFDDGLLDVTIIPPFPVTRILREAYKLFNGKLLGIKELVVRKVKSVTVMPLDGCPEPVEIDGEIVGNVPVRLDVIPGRINVLHAR